MLIPLTTEEAEIFYNVGTTNSCPYKFLTSEKKVWWIAHTTTINLRLTICQTCYHQNKLGKYDMNIKKFLSPFITEGIKLCCDGATDDESYPLKFNENLMGAIYMTRPYLSLLNSYFVANTNSSNLSTKRRVINYTSLESGSYEIYLQTTLDELNKNVAVTPTIPKFSILQVGSHSHILINNNLQDDSENSHGSSVIQKLIDNDEINCIVTEVLDNEIITSDAPHKFLLFGNKIKINITYDFQFDQHKDHKYTVCFAIKDVKLCEFDITTHIVDITKSCNSNDLS